MKPILEFLRQYWFLLVLIPGAVTWSVSTHNTYLYAAISPLLRASYVQRINGYREMRCAGAMTDVTEAAYQEALLDYENLVGRPISPARRC